jgi:hypothetical protein
MTLDVLIRGAPKCHGCGSVTPLAGPRAPVLLDEAIRAACRGVAGINPEVFRSLLSPEDIKDIEGGGIHPKTLAAYARSFAEGLRSGRIVVREGAKPGPVSGSIVDAELEAARKGRIGVPGGGP